MDYNRTLTLLVTTVGIVNTITVPRSVDQFLNTITVRLLFHSILVVLFPYHLL